GKGIPRSQGHNRTGRPMEGKGPNEGQRQGRRRKAEPLPDLPVLADHQARTRGLHGHRHPDPGQHHLHSQVRSDSPGRSSGPWPLPELHHVPSADVLGDDRQRQRRRYLGRWRQSYGRLACWILCISLLLTTCCRRVSDSSWQSRYSEARSKFRLGYTEATLRLADAGYRESLKTDQVWNWRFRILMAQALLRQGAPDRAITLLAPEPPANSPPDVSVRRKTIQGYAFCRLNKPQEAEAALGEAEGLGKSGDPSLVAEIAFTRGVCAMFL